MSAIGGGIDVNGIVASLISIDRESRVLPVQFRQVGVTTKLSLYGQIKSAFSSFEDKANDLIKSFLKYQTEFNNTEKKSITNNGNGTVTISTPSNGEAEFVNTKTSSNSSPSVLTLRNEPPYGNYQINVQNLAQSQELRVSTGSTNPNAEFGGGLLTVDFASGRQENFSFAQDDGSGNVANATAQDIVNQINASNKGLSASFDNATGEIVLTSSQAGTDNAFTLSTSGEINQGRQGLTPAFGPNDGNNNVNNNAGFSRFNQGIVTNTAKDITASIDDGTGPQTFTSKTGDFFELGVDFTVLTTGSSLVRTFDRQDPNPDYIGPTTEVRSVQAGDPAPGETVFLTTPSQTAINGAVDAFVKEYNSLVTLLKNGQKKGTELDRDTAPVRLEQGLRDIFNQVVGGTETKLDLGFTISKEGTLSYDKDKLKTKLTNDPEAFSRIFADNIAKDFAAYAKQVNAEGGVVKAKSDQLNRTLEGLKSLESRETDRLFRQEKLYRKQFIALDRVLSELQSSQGFLAQGLASLQATFNSSRN